MTLIDALLQQATATHSPISGTFELTGRCNLSCKMCYIHNMTCDQSLLCKELSTDQWIALADKAKEAGTLILLLTGGEPTLRKDFCTIYKACAERGFLVSINTNASLLTEEMFELFRSHPPLRVNVSIYGMSENIYESMCGNGAAFHRVIENVKHLRELGIVVQINFTATPYNSNEIERVQQFAEQIGAKIQHTAYMFPPTRTACATQEQALRFTPEESAEQMVRFLKTNKVDDGFAAYCREKALEAPARLEDCGDVYEGVRCRAGRASYWITYDGKMLPCGMIPNIAFSTLPDNFEQAWKNTVAAFSEIKMPTGCTHCSEYERCDVCPAVCLAEKGDFSVVPEYICQKNSAYRQQLLQLARELEANICD